MRFKDKNKYTLSRIVGKPAIIKQENDDAEILTEAKTYRINRAIHNLSKKDFLLTGSVNAGTFYTLDLLYCKVNIMSKPWSERMTLLDNKFEWNNSIKYETPLVASNEHEFKKLIKTYTMNPETDRILVKKYNGKFLDDDYTIEVD